MIENIADVAKAEGVQFNSLFISNVYDWDRDNEKQNLFLKNMEKLSNDKTIIIDVVPSSENHWTVNVAHYIDPQSKQTYSPQAIRKTSPNRRLTQPIYALLLKSYLRKCNVVGSWRNIPFSMVII